MRIIIVASFYILLTSCKSPGTKTGNPGFSAGGDPPKQDVNLLGPESLRYLLCKKVEECSIIEYAECESQSDQSEALVEALGFSVAEYATFSELVLAFQESSPPSISAKDALTCAKSMYALTCHDIEDYEIIGSNKVNLEKALALEPACGSVSHE